jgi:predicted amino acid-binding ACT domain protein
MPKRSKTESAKSKVESAVALSGVGGAIAGPIGAGVGALTGLIIGDARYVFPVDMVAIPAFQAYMIQGNPHFQVYMRAGESLVPTGGNVDDVQQAVEDARLTGDVVVNTNKKKKKTAYQRRYSKAFNKVKSKYKLRSGKWKKDGFKKAVREAHKMAGGK